MPSASDTTLWVILSLVVVIAVAWGLLERLEQARRAGFVPSRIQPDRYRAYAAWLNASQGVLSMAAFATIGLSVWLLGCVAGLGAAIRSLVNGALVSSRS